MSILQYQSMGILKYPYVLASMSYIKLGYSELRELELRVNGPRYLEMTSLDIVFIIYILNNVTDHSHTIWNSLIRVQLT